MEINFKKYKFFNLPQILKESDYHETCNLFVNNLKDNPNIKSIYLAGGPWVPGISDLDILIIYHQKIKKETYRPTPWKFSIKEKHLYSYMDFDIWNLTENSFRNLYYINSPTSLKLLWGEEILLRSPKNELSQDNFQSLNAILIFDFLINKLLFSPRHFKSFKIDVRRMLGEVYSLRYTLELLQSIDPQPIGIDFISRIKKLREEWFDKDQIENLQELVSVYSKSIDLILDIVVKLNNFIQNQNLPMSDIVLKNRKYYIVFNKQWTKEKFLDNFKKGYIFLKRPFSDRIIENFKLLLPLPLSYFLMVYANYSGSQSNWIKECLVGYQKITTPIDKGMREHIKMTNDFVQDSIDHSFARIPLSYGCLAKKQRFISYLGEKLILFLRRIKN